MAESEIKLLPDGRVDPAWIAIEYMNFLKNPNELEKDGFRLDGHDLTKLSTFNLNLYFQKFPDKKLLNCNLQKVKLICHDFALVDLSGCQLKGAVVFHDSDRPMTKVRADGLRLIGCSGLWGESRIVWAEELVYSRARPPVVEYQSGFRKIVPGWETMRKVGALPVFSLSSITLVCLLSFATFASWYNDQVSSFKHFVVLQENLGQAGQVVELIDTIRVIPQAYPGGVLLLSLLSLIIASNVYSMRCPELVQRYSREEWGNAGREMVEYRAASVHRILSRCISLLFYAIGGSLALTYLAYKSVVAIGFYFDLW